MMNILIDGRMTHTTTPFRVGFESISNYPIQPPSIVKPSKKTTSSKI